MPKIALGQWTDKNKSLVRKIKSLRIDRDESIDRLADAARIKRNTYFAHMKDPEKITVRELRAYIRVLRIPAEDIIAALYLDKEERTYSR